MKELGFDLTNCGELGVVKITPGELGGVKKTPGELGGVKKTPGELGGVKKTPESMLVDLSNIVPLSSSVLCFLCLTNDLFGTFNRSSFKPAVWPTMVRTLAKLVCKYK